MKKLLLVLCFFNISLFCWEWNGIKEDMTYEETIEILGSPLNIEAISNQSDLNYSEVVIANYEYKGYKLSITFCRYHNVSRSIWNGQIGVEYNCAENFKVIALSIEPKTKSIEQKDIYSEFGKPKKVGRHLELGIREEFENTAIVDYEKDTTTITKIKFGELSYIR